MFDENFERLSFPVFVSRVIEDQIISGTSTIVIELKVVVIVQKMGEKKMHLLVSNDLRMKERNWGYYD